MRIYRLVLLLFIATIVYAADPVVENVRFVQRTDGTLLVDIYYDVTDADGDPMAITVTASNDNGVTWTLPCATVSGDTGNGILTGANKHIVWDFYADNPGASGGGFKVRVTADDLANTMTDIDGNVYKTVKIGDQEWMAEDLKVTHYRNGEAIPNVTDGATWAGLTTGAYCYNNNNNSYASTYGALYNWFAVTDSRNIAPAGWHVPTDAEWKQLEMYLGMSQSVADQGDWRGTDEGGKLKETGTSHWSSPNTGATNSSGFTARPGGYRDYYGGDFYGMGDYAYYWAATEDGTYYAWGRILYFGNSSVYRSRSYKSYGFSVRLVRDSETMTDIDGNVYKTVKIGDQEWMAEDLKVTHYRNGEPISNVTDNTAWAGLTTGAYCYYDNNNSYASTYGALYNWFAVNDSRNIAPAGWHVPTDAEWKQLEMYLGMSQSEEDSTGWRGTDEGGKLKETGTSHWISPNEGATNSSGFTARPGGYRDYDNGSFRFMGNIATYWTATEYNTDYDAWYRNLGYNNDDVRREASYKVYGFSVRLVRDN